jgi:hypothetical protein
MFHLKNHLNLMCGTESESNLVKGGKMTDIEFLSVHGLAVRKAAGPAAVADLLGLNEEEVSAALESAAGKGLVAGARGTFMVAPDGQAMLAAQYPVVYAEAREDGALAEAYERFEKVNTGLLALFTDWQTVPTGSTRIPNDHEDKDYDNGIIDRLGDLHERAERVVGRCAEAQPRLSRYLERLESAYDRVLAGEIDWVSGVRIDSYHTVWFELHEDLLRMLGRTRQE